MDKKEKKEKKILTDNRLSTINKRETSLEGLTTQLENSGGESAIYNLTSDNNKNAIFHPKISITEKDLEEVPFLPQIKESITYWEEKLKTATGKDAYIAKKSLIDTRKDQYVVKNAYRKPTGSSPQIQPKSIAKPDLKETILITNTGDSFPIGFSLIDPNIVSKILCNYSKLQSEVGSSSDLWYVLKDLKELSAEVFAENPMYEKLVKFKIKGYSNLEIKEKLLEEFGETHSEQYISNLWRKRIPKLIADKAEEQYLDWYYTYKKKGKYKQCGKCGKVKLAHKRYFNKNAYSKDGFYSICKECRSKKKKKGGAENS